MWKKHRASHHKASSFNYNNAKLTSMIVVTPGARMDVAYHTRRIDIQALRGVAVLIVVLYHLKLGGVAAGYLGVDIFFVISGFLITDMVARAIRRGEFSVREFYFRRARRLLPAAYTTLLATALLAPWFLNQRELRDFGAQVLGALTFTGNIVLWQQSGYFEGAADLKPLLHVWSLAVEEQYYFVLPALLLWLGPRRWRAGLALLLLASLALCLLGSYFKPVATFYLLPTRAWEMLIGSLAALCQPAAPAAAAALAGPNRALRLLFAPSLLCLLLLPLWPLPGGHPGLNAALVCGATAVIILRSHPALEQSRPSRLLAGLGDLSYSLYLVHWPIIAFIKNAWMGDAPQVPATLTWSALGLSLLGAWLLYRYVEVPMRSFPYARRGRLAAGTLAASATLALITPLTLQLAPALDMRELRRPNFGLAVACEYGGAFEPKAQCSTRGTPTMLVWGDSYAMHLVPGLAEGWAPHGMIQATMSRCGPLLGMAPYSPAAAGQADAPDRRWAESCIAFNRSVLDYLRRTDSIHTVVLSSPLQQYLDAGQFDLLVERQQGYAAIPSDPAAVHASLRATVDAVRRLGKRVALVAPPPSSDFNIGDCLERQLRGAVTLGDLPGCAVSRAAYQHRRAPVLALLQQMQRDGTPVISFDAWLCGPEACRTTVDGTMLYRDSGHFSVEGSRLVARRMLLAEQIRQQAR
jgi:peptidoglycan/LPS O-acetylase OafA/YrhL